MVMIGLLQINANSQSRHFITKKKPSRICITKTKEAGKSGFFFIPVVGTAGFEPATSWSRTKRTTKLCYVPMRFLARGGL